MDGLAADAGADAVSAGTGEGVVSEGAPLARTTPGTPGVTPGEPDGPCTEGVVVRAMTSTRNARTISATRSVWPPARVGAPGSGPERPRDGSRTRGVALTAGHRRDASSRGPDGPDAGSDQLPPAAPYVAQSTCPGVRQICRCLPRESCAGGVIAQHRCSRDAYALRQLPSGDWSKGQTSGTALASRRRSERPGGRSDTGMRVRAWTPGSIMTGRIPRAAADTGSAMP